MAVKYFKTAKAANDFKAKKTKAGFDAEVKRTENSFRVVWWSK